MHLAKIAYKDLNARQKENFNFQKVSAVLADYGFVTFRLSDDCKEQTSSHFTSLALFCAFS